jgi:hypothetical protein
MLDQGLGPAPVVPLASPESPDRSPGPFNFSKTILPAPAKQGAPKTPAAMATRR